MLFTHATTKKIFLFGLSAVLSASHAFAYLIAPGITSFSPASGPVGTLVTINGTDLASPTALTIGGHAAIMVSNTGSVLVAMVMPDAATGAVSLTTASGTATSSGNFTVTPTPYPSSQQGNKLAGSNSSANAQQGRSVSVSADGNTAIFGGNADNSNQGAAWVYTRSGGVWTQQGLKLVGTGNSGAANQGYSVSLSADGNTAIVGGYTDNNDKGAAWVFTRSGNTWTLQIKLMGTGNNGNAQQGYSVSLSADGNTAMVGGPGDQGDKGAAWVFTRSGNTWTQQDKLEGSGSTGKAKQGYSVSLSADGNTAMVGGYGDNSNQGAAWVFARSGNTWTQQDKLEATDNTANSFQGYSVSLSADGNTAMVGGIGDNSNQGAAWVYTRNGTTWAQQGNKLEATDNTTNSYQGYSVSLSADGNTAMVGGSTDNSNQGAAWVFTRNGITWAQQGAKLVGSGVSSFANQGTSVSLSADGNTAMVGGSSDNSSKGAVWVYYIPVPTIQSSYLTFTNTTTTTTSASWTNGNGLARAVFVSALATSGGPEPFDGINYTAAANYGSGTAIGNWYCVYNGTGNTVNITGLTAGTTYRVMSIEYNGTAANRKYLIRAHTGNPASLNTLYLGITPNGNNATSGTNYINANGKILATAALTKYGQIIPCPTSLTITHTLGTVAPATATINYGVTTTGLPDAAKCWITRNLGAAVQATSTTDAAIDAAGWYWQFNRMRGYTLGDDLGSSEPAWTITTINENSNWLAANDPCTLQLGTGWRIPTQTEWTAVTASWSGNFANAYESALKLHAGGTLKATDGSVSGRGVTGNYWSGTQSSGANGHNTTTTGMSSSSKASGFPLRCIRD